MNNFTGHNPVPHVAYRARLQRLPGNYTIHFPDLPGLAVTAPLKYDQNTKEGRAALHEKLGQALWLHLSGMIEDGESLPRPGQGKLMVFPATPNPISLALNRAFENSGLTQQELGERMNCSQPSISRLLDPFYHNHTAPTLRRFADALNLDLSVTLTPRSA